MRISDWSSDVCSSDLQESPSRREPSKLQSGYSSGDVLQVTARPAVPQVKGSCHCGAVSFSVFSRAAVPYMRCYCSICRKTAGGGGYAINLSGEAVPLAVQGKEHVDRKSTRLNSSHKCAPRLQST